VGIAGNSRDSPGFDHQKERENIKKHVKIPFKNQYLNKGKSHRRVQILSPIPKPTP